MQRHRLVIPGRKGAEKEKEGRVREARRGGGGGGAVLVRSSVTLVDEEFVSRDGFVG